MSDFRNVVDQAKADLVAHGVDVSGNCGAFAIVALAARRIPGAGVKKKPIGNNCNGFSIKSIMFANGDDFQVLISPGTVNGADWTQFGKSDTSLFVAASALAPYPWETSGPTPAPMPAPSETPELDRLSADIEALQIEIRALNAQLATVIANGVKVHL